MDFSMYMKDLVCKLKTIEEIVFNDEEELSSREFSRFAEEMLDAMTKLAEWNEKQEKEIEILKKMAHFDKFEKIVQELSLEDETKVDSSSENKPDKDNMYT